MAFNQSCFGILPNPYVVDADYLYYSLKEMVLALKKAANGSVFDTITAEILNELTIDLPNIETQRKVSKYLCDLDGKIIENNKINDNLSTNQLRSPDNSFESNVSRNSINRWFSKNVDWIFLNSGKTNSLNSFAFLFDGITTFISASPPSQTA